MSYLQVATGRPPTRYHQKRNQKVIYIYIYIYIYIPVIIALLYTDWT